MSPYDPLDEQPKRRRKKREEPGLFSIPVEQPKLHREWLKFHIANPHVYKLFTRFAQKATSSGRKRYSARTIWHVMRWHADFETTDTAYKLNDHHTPFYARLWMEEHPQYPGFFETRRAVADETL